MTTPHACAYAPPYQDLEDTFETTSAISNFAASLHGSGVDNRGDRGQSSPGTGMDRGEEGREAVLIEYMNDSRAALAEQVEKLQADLRTSQGKLHKLERGNSQSQRTEHDQGGASSTSSSSDHEHFAARVNNPNSELATLRGGLIWVQERLMASPRGTKGGQRASTLLGMSARVLEQLEMEGEGAEGGFFSPPPRRRRGGEEANIPSPTRGHRRGNSSMGSKSLFGGGDKGEGTEEGSPTSQAARLREDLSTALGELEESDVMIDGLVMTNKGLSEELAKLESSLNSAAQDLRQSDLIIEVSCNTLVAFL
jgi:hypothetical protein